MRPQRIVLHERHGHLLREGGIEAALLIDRGEFLVLAFAVGLQFAPFQREGRLLRIGLRAHRHVFPGGHRHGPGHEPCDAGHHHVAARRVGRRHAEHEACGGHDPVVGAQYRGAEPADAAGAMRFPVAQVHAYPSLSVIAGEAVRTLRADSHALSESSATPASGP